MWKQIFALLVVFSMAMPAISLAGESESSPIFSPLDTIVNEEIDIEYSDGNYGLSYHAMAGEKGAHPVNRVVVRNGNRHVYQNIYIQIRPWVKNPFVIGGGRWEKNPVPVRRNIELLIHDNDGDLIKRVSPPSNNYGITPILRSPKPYDQYGVEIPLNISLDPDEAIQVEPVILKVPKIRGNFASDITVVGEYVAGEGSAPAYSTAPIYSTLEVIGFPEATWSASDGSDTIQSSEDGGDTNYLGITNNGTEPIDELVFSFSDLAGVENATDTINTDGFSVRQYANYVGSISSNQTNQPFFDSEVYRQMDRDIFDVEEVPGGKIIAVRGGMFYMNDTSTEFFYETGPTSYLECYDIEYSNNKLLSLWRNDNPIVPSIASYSKKTTVVAHSYPDLELIGTHTPWSYKSGQYTELFDIEVLPDGNFLTVGTPNMAFYYPYLDPIGAWADLSSTFFPNALHEPNGVTSVDVYVNETGQWEMTVAGSNGYRYVAPPPPPPPPPPPRPPIGGGGGIGRSPPAPNENQVLARILEYDNVTWLSGQTAFVSPDMDQSILSLEFGFRDMHMNDDHTLALLETNTQGVYEYDFNTGNLSLLVGPTIVNTTHQDWWQYHHKSNRTISPEVVYNSDRDEWAILSYDDLHIYDGITLTQVGHNISFYIPHFYHNPSQTQTLGGIHWSGTGEWTTIYALGQIIEYNWDTEETRYLYNTERYMDTTTIGDNVYVATGGHIIRYNHATTEFSFHNVRNTRYITTDGQDLYYIDDNQYVKRASSDFSSTDTLYTVAPNSTAPNKLYELEYIDGALYWFETYTPSITWHSEVRLYRHNISSGTNTMVLNETDFNSYWVAQVWETDYGSATLTTFEDRYLVFSWRDSISDWVSIYDTVTGDFLDQSLDYLNSQLPTLEPEYSFLPSLNFREMYHDERTDLVWATTGYIVLAFNYSLFLQGDFYNATEYVQRTWPSLPSTYNETVFQTFYDGIFYPAEGTDSVYFMSSYRAVLPLNTSSPTTLENITKEMIWNDRIETGYEYSSLSYFTPVMEIDGDILVVDNWGDWGIFNASIPSYERLAGATWIEGDTLVTTRTVNDGDDGSSDGYATVTYEEGNSPFTVQYLYEPIPPGATRYYSFSLPGIDGLDQPFSGTITVYAYSNGTPSTPLYVPYELHPSYAPTLATSLYFSGEYNHLLFNETILTENDVTSMNSFYVDNSGSGSSVDKMWFKFDDLQPDAPPPTVEDTIPVRDNAELLFYPDENYTRVSVETHDGSTPIATFVPVILKQKFGQCFIADTSEIRGIEFQYDFTHVSHDQELWFELFEYNSTGGYLEGAGMATTEHGFYEQGRTTFYARFSSDVSVTVGEKYVVFPMIENPLTNNASTLQDIMLYDTEPAYSEDYNYSYIFADYSSGDIHYENVAFRMAMKVHSPVGEMAIQIDADGVASLNSTLLQNPLYSQGFMGEFKMKVHNTSLGSDTVYPAPYSYLGDFEAHMVSGDDGPISWTTYGVPPYSPSSTTLYTPDYNRVIDENGNVSWNVLVNQDYLAGQDPSPDANISVNFSLISDYDIEYTLSHTNKTFYPYNPGTALGTPVIDGVHTDNEYLNATSREYDGENPTMYGNAGHQSIYTWLQDDDYIYLWVDDVGATSTNIYDTGGYTYDGYDYGSYWNEVGIDVDGDGILNSTYEPIFSHYQNNNISDGGSIAWFDYETYANPWHSRDYGGYWGNYSGDYDSWVVSYPIEDWDYYGVDIATSFGPSENSLTDHVQFEYRIPKNTSYYTIGDDFDWIGWISEGYTVEGMDYGSSYYWNGNRTWDNVVGWETNDLSQTPDPNADKVWVHVDAHFNEPVYDEARVYFQSNVSGEEDINRMPLYASMGVTRQVNSQVVTLDPNPPMSLFTDAGYMRFADLYSGTQAVENLDVYNGHVYPIEQMTIYLDSLEGSNGTVLSSGDYYLSMSRVDGSTYVGMDGIINIENTEILDVGDLLHLAPVVADDAVGYNPNETYTGSFDVIYVDTLGQAFVLRDYPIVVDDMTYQSGASPQALIEGADELLSTVNETINFQSSSTTPIGYIVNWTWDFGDGTMGYGPNATHRYLEPGYYTVTLTVLNSYGLYSSTTMNVSVSTSATLPFIEMLSPREIEVDVAFDEDLTLVYTFEIHNSPQSVLKLSQYDNSSNKASPYNVTLEDEQGNILTSSDVEDDSFSYSFLDDSGELTLYVRFDSQEIAPEQSNIWFNLSVEDNDGNIGDVEALHTTVNKGPSRASMWAMVGIALLGTVLVALALLWYYKNVYSDDLTTSQEIVVRRPGAVISNKRKRKPYMREQKQDGDMRRRR